MVEVTLHTPEIHVNIDGKDYTVSFSEDGIFIQTNDLSGVWIQKESATHNWLYVK